MAKGWTDEELAASVDAYNAMARMEAEGRSYNKAQVYRDLADRFKRSPGSFEYRMQNISAIYNELGLPWIAGLKPADHIGSDMKLRLLQLLQKHVGGQTAVTFKHGKQRTWELILDAIGALNDSASRRAVRDWIVTRHPTYNVKNLVDLEMLSVNSPSRTSYHQNAHPRMTNTGSSYDRLFKVGQGRAARFELYDPEIHGIWEIYADPNAGNRQGMSVRIYAGPVALGLAKADLQEDEVGGFSPQNVVDARRKVLAEIHRRQGQTTFRESLRKAYEGRCAITGCQLMPILEAAHIHPYKGLHTNVISNGLLLRADVHTLFDLYLIAIDVPAMTIAIAPELTKTEYSQLAGKSVFIPANSADRPSVTALEWHRSLCSWAN